MYVVSARQDSIPSVIDRTDGICVCGDSKSDELIGFRDRHCSSSAVGVSVNCAFTNDDLHITGSRTRVVQFAFRGGSVEANRFTS